MSRAAVLIGVNRTGGLPVLRDAAASARRMASWAHAQGVHHVEVMTDEDGGRVDVWAIKKAIRGLNELGTVEQLLVFFAGHGINVSRGERWLLTDAPSDPQAAVNVPGSADLARWGAIPYVVMVSDACRTAAEGIEAQGVTGSEIFPNEEVAQTELPVDQFFACKLGRPSYEIADSTTTAKEYRAIYTQALVAALEGADAAVLDPQGYVRPHPLKRFLQAEMARRLRDLQLQTKLIQVPDARISSDETAWISRVVHDGEAPPGAGGSGGGGTGASRVRARLTAPAVLDGMLEPILADDLDVFAQRLGETRASDEPGIVDIAASVESGLSPFGPMHQETQCGFKVRGARVSAAVAGRAVAEQLGPEVVRVHTGAHAYGNVLLVFESGRGVALPAIAEFLTAVTVEDGEVVDVTYEPSDDSSRWGEFSERAREVRALRSVAASSSREGAFALEGRDALEVAKRMRYAKGVDPALAVYAAYAYADHGRRDLIREMAGHLRSDLGATLFDVALLAREAGPEDRRMGFAPLLAQGWALLPASRLTLPPSLQGLGRHVLPSSLWTVYDAGGVARIRDALLAGHVP